MALPPYVYSRLLGEKITEHEVKVWLVNTGWSGGPVGTGSRMKIAHTRAMVNAALQGKLDGIAFSSDPVFGLQIPASCPNVPSEVLNPRNTWADKDAYDKKAADLISRFKKNFEQFAGDVLPEVLNAGPGINHH